MPISVKILLSLLIVMLVFCAGGAVGEITSKKAVMREAYQNGVATKEIVGEKVVYRWIETHKIGYDAE